VRQMRLAAGLRPDPLGELQRSPIPSSRNRRKHLLLREREGERQERAREEKGKGRGENCLLFISLLATGLNLITC